jgi:hypothetical protein
MNEDYAIIGKIYDRFILMCIGTQDELELRLDSSRMLISEENNGAGDVRLIRLADINIEDLLANKEEELYKLEDLFLNDDTNMY